MYESPGGEVRVDVRFEDESVWLTQRQMAKVFRTSIDNVSLHLKNIYTTGELKEAATTEDFSVVRSEGQRQVRRKIRHYNLDAIISIGYRINSKRAVLRKERSQGMRTAAPLRRPPRRSARALLASARG